MMTKGYLRFKLLVSWILNNSDAQNEEKVTKYIVINVAVTRFCNYWSMVMQISQGHWSMVTFTQCQYFAPVIVTVKVVCESVLIKVSCQLISLSMLMLFLLTFCRNWVRAFCAASVATFLVHVLKHCASTVTRLATVLETVNIAIDGVYSVNAVGSKDMMRRYSIFYMV